MVIITLLAAVLVYFLLGAFCRFVLGWSWRKYFGSIFDWLRPF
jgi:hypothetical protein